MSSTLFQIEKASIEGKTIGFDVLDQLLKAKTDKAIHKFIQMYLADGQTLFGVQCEENIGLERKPTLGDCKSLASIIRTGLWLAKLIRDPLLIYEDVDLFKLAGLVGEPTIEADNMESLCLCVPLYGGLEATTFLRENLHRAPFDLPTLSLSPSSKEAESLSLLHRSTREGISDVLAGFFDGLSKIMLGDLNTTVRLNKIVVTSTSLASSLWLTFLETLDKCEVVLCEECRNPTFAPPKRKNARRFCSDTCRQRHYRHP